MGPDKVSISGVQTTTVQNTDGTTTTTTTSATANFSADSKSGGQFLSASSTTSSVTTNSKGEVVSSTPTVSNSSIGYGGAAKILGGGNLSGTADIAARQSAPGFGSMLLSDHHSVVQGGAAVVGLGCLATPCGAAVAVGSGIVGAVDFAAEKLKWW